MSYPFRRLLPQALVILTLASGAPALAQNDLAEVQVQMAEARRHFDALEYEQTVPALDRVIAILGARRTDDTRKTLADAYEMRARTRFGLGDGRGAREDFVSLLKVEPSRTLSGQISPRVVALFEDVQKSTIVQVALAVTPANAEVMLDGVAVPSNATLPVIVGEHTLTARRLGYKPGTATFTAAAGAKTDATLTLARSSAVLSIVTSPADVDVLVDGVARGKTVAGPPSGDYTERAARAGVPMSALSAVLVIPDLAAGAHRVELRKPCFVGAERRMDITELDDVVFDPVKLEPAVSAVTASAAQPGATVVIDGQDKGPAPFTGELCEGEHLVEIRSPNGRFSRRFEAKAGQPVQIAGSLRPAFALVSASSTGPLSTDLRSVIERAMEPVQSVLLFAPPADRLDQTLRASQLPPDWLAFDANKRPLGVSSDINAPMRRELSGRIAKAFDAQGVASVTVPSTANRNRVVLTLLGAGNAEPDVVELSLDRPETIAEAVTLLNRPVALRRASAGLTVVDVADVAGAAVVAVDANGPAAKAGVQVGDVIVKANDAAIADSAAWTTVLTSKADADTVAIELKDRAGAAKRAELKVLMTPRLIGMNDQTLLANRILADLRTRLTAPADAAEEPIVRLNIAAALARLQQWNEARAELQRVQLPNGPGVGGGTVQYLLGLCAENLGNRSEAEAAWKAAAASDSMLTEDGPPVKELAEAKIADLQRRPAAR